MTPLRDKRIGRIIRAHNGRRILEQAEEGVGTRDDNRRRLADWFVRYSRIPIEQTLKGAKHA